MPNTIAWNFRHMHEEPGKFSCSRGGLCEYAQRLKDDESSTRCGTEGRRNSSHGWKTVRKPGKEPRDRIKQKPCFAGRRLSQLALSGRCRAFGFYQGNVFRFVFLDRHHEAYAVAR